jgi:hypothetical protein
MVMQKAMFSSPIVPITDSGLPAGGRPEGWQELSERGDSGCKWQHFEKVKGGSQLRSYFVTAAPLSSRP